VASRRGTIARHYVALSFNSIGEVKHFDRSPTNYYALRNIYSLLL